MFAMFVNAGVGRNGVSRCGAIVFDDQGSAVDYMDGVRTAMQVDQKYPGAKIMWDYVPVTPAFIRGLQKESNRKD